MNLSITDIVDITSRLGVASLALLGLVAVLRGWVVPRWVHDQVVTWNDELLDYADKSIVAFNRLASVSVRQMNVASAERGVLQEGVDDIRDQLGTVPGPSSPKKPTRYRGRPSGGLNE